MQIGSYHLCKHLGILVLVSVFCTQLGCGKAADSQSSVASEKTEDTLRREGDIRIADQRKRVVPFVMHRAEMDLFVQCRLFAESRKDKEKASELCYQTDGRQEIKRLRIEYRESLKIAEVLAFLRATGQCAHFIVDVTGTLYQTLDLIYPCRRDGVYQNGEVRVISGDETGHQKIKTALMELFPTMTVGQEPFGPPEDLNDQ